MSTHKEVKALLRQFSGQNSTVTIPRIYIDIMGDLNGAAFLNQLIFWSDKGRDGWFYKTYADWTEEIGLSKYQIGRCADKCKELGILETEVHRANGFPTVHYRLLEDTLTSLIVKFLDERKLSFFTNESEVSLLSESEVSSQSLTEEYQKNTTEDIEKNNFSVDAGNNPPSKLNEIENAIIAETKLPIFSGGVSGWFEPIKRMSAAGATIEDIRQAVIILTDKNYSISSARSLENTVISLAAKRKRSEALPEISGGAYFYG